jgi:hypothetical protein
MINSRDNALVLSRSRLERGFRAGAQNFGELPMYERAHNCCSWRNGKHIGLSLEPWFRTLLCWSSETWSKASEKATVGWIKIGLDSYVDPDHSSLSRFDVSKP